TSAALIVGTPYLVGSLLLLDPGSLLQIPGDILTTGAFTWSVVLAFVGRVLVVFCFNEAVAFGLGLATTRTVLQSGKAHLSLLLVAVAAILAPWIAAAGSGQTVASGSPLIRLLAVLLTTVLSQAGLWAEVYLITGMVLDAIHGQAPSQGSVFEHPVQGM